MLKQVIGFLLTGVLGIALPAAGVSPPTAAWAAAGPGAGAPPLPPNPTSPPPAPQSSNPTAAILVKAISSDTFDFSSMASASSGARIVSYAWDFGDGKHDNRAAVSHRYRTSGAFSVALTVTDSNQKSATTTRSVLATVSPPPAPPAPPPLNPAPPPPVPPPTTGTPYYTQIGPAHTTFKYASRALAVQWQKGGGDWRDANGVLNGPTATSSIVPSSDGMQSMDIRRIDGDVLLQGAAYVDSVRIDGVPVTAFSTRASSVRSVPLPNSGTRQPVFIKNPMRGRTLTFAARFVAGMTLRADAVAAPEIPSYLPYVGPSNVPDVWELEMISEQQLFEFMGRGRFGRPSWDPRPGKAIHDPQFGVDSYGIHYLRFAGITNAERLIAWRPGFDPREEAYCRYLLWIEDDVADGMTEAGMKLPGLFAGYPIGPTERVSWRMWHGPVDPANRGIYRITDYRYDAATPRNQYPDGPETGAHLIANRWNVIEQRGKLNTPGMADGVLEIWLNGHLVMRDAAKVWRTDASTKWDSIHANVFHGGQDLFPSQKIHYRIAKIAVSSRYIGVPKELLNAR